MKPDVIGTESRPLSFLPASLIYSEAGLRTVELRAEAGLRWSSGKHLLCVGVRAAEGMPPFSRCERGPQSRPDGADRCHRSTCPAATTTTTKRSWLTASLGGPSGGGSLVTEPIVVFIRAGLHLLTNLYLHSMRHLKGVGHSVCSLPCKPPLQTSPQGLREPENHRKASREPAINFH